MTMCDVQGAVARLTDSYDSLRAAWADRAASWDDSASRRFEKERLEPLDPIMRRAIHAMQRLAEVLAQAERECSETRT